MHTCIWPVQGEGNISTACSREKIHKGTLLLFLIPNGKINGHNTISSKTYNWSVQGEGNIRIDNSWEIMYISEYFCFLLYPMWQLKGKT